MKKLYLFVLVSIVVSHVFSQGVPLSDVKRKSGLFRQLPDSIVVNIPSLEALLQLSAGSDVKMDISRYGEFSLQGTVISVSKKYNNRIHAVTLRSDAFEGAVFNLSKSVLDNGQELFRGTWVNKDYDEIFVLESNGKECTLIKKRFGDVFME